MYSLYLNNYRGFRKNLIKFNDVNFLVGENSTGKTSLMKALEIFSSQDLWFGGEINKDIYSSFDDITNSLNFEMGVSLDSFYAKFLFEKDRNYGTPRLKYVKLRINELSFILERKNTKYHIYNNSYEDKEKFFNNEIYINFLEKKNEVIPLKIMPLAFSFSKVEEVFKGNEAKNKKNSIYGGEILNVIMSKLLDEKIVFQAPIRELPKRIYEFSKIKYSPEGAHIPHILDKVISKDENKKILNDFGKESSLFDEIYTERYSKSDKTSPFYIVINIKGKKHKLFNVGYGVSQILPLIVEPLINSNQWFAIQQPEVHLHPKAQAAFGQFIFTLSNEKKKNFIIETHSDFLIDRFRLMLNQNGNNTIKSQVLFFKKDTEGNNNIDSIIIEKNGFYSEEQPREYKDFFIKETIKILSIN